MNQRVQRRSGFSLVEAAVAAGVVSLAMGIGVPGLRFLRDTSHTLQCTRNLKDLGGAFQSHAAEHDFRLPMPDFSLPAKPADPAYEDAGQRFVGERPPRLTIPGGLWLQTLKPYLSIPYRATSEEAKTRDPDGKMLCPLDTDPYSGMAHCRDGAPDWYRGSYAYNQELGNRRITAIRKTADTILVAESAWSVIHAMEASDPRWYVRSLEDRHDNEGIRFFFADGHLDVREEVSGQVFHP